MEIDAEHAGQQNAVAHLELAKLHVSKQFVDDGLPANPAGELWGSVLRHVLYTGPPATVVCCLLTRNVTLDGGHAGGGFSHAGAANIIFYSLDWWYAHHRSPSR